MTIHAKFPAIAAQDEKKLAAKYDHFVSPSQFYNKIANGYAFIGAILAHPAFVDSRASSVPVLIKSQRDVGQMGVEGSIGAKFLPNVRSDPKTGVRTVMEMPPLSCQVSGIDQDATRQQQLAFETGRKLLAVLFPDLDLESVRLQHGQAHNLNITRELPIEALATIEVPDVGKLDLSKWTSDMRGRVRYLLNVNFIQVRDGNPDKISIHNDVWLEVGVRAEITFPMEYALWCTSSTEEDFLPVAFWSHIRHVHSWWTRADSKGKPPEAVRQHPDSNGRMSKRVAEKFGLKPRPRTNAEGLCSVPAGVMYWVPPDEGTKGFANVLGSCVDPSTGDISISSLKSLHVATDWIIDKMLLTDATGTGVVVDLTGARPLVPAVLAHVMGSRCDLDIFGRMVKFAAKLGVVLSSAENRAFNSALERLTWDEMIDVPFNADDENSPLNSDLWSIGRKFAEAYDKMKSSTTIPVFEQFEIRPYFAFFGEYAKKRAEFAAVLAEQIAIHRAAPVVDESKPVQLKDMPGVEGVMPHQARVDASLSKFPLRAIFDVSPGGGKSWSYIDDVTKLMYAGKIRRPGIAMPRNLIAQFCKEVIKFTKGRIRLFIINNRVWNGFVRRIGTNPVAIKKLLNGQPKNTLYVVDYEWLRMEAEDVIMGDSVEKFFPRATFLTDIGFDYFALDESQRAKNLGTSRTMATAVLTSQAAVHDDGEEGFTRIGSGTLIGNTARDLLGQMAQLEPMALGELGDSIKNTDRISIAEQPELSRRIDSFAKRILVTRREWAHLLPPILERVWPCVMTDAQQKFYDLFLTEMQDKILADPKIRKLMDRAEKGDETAEAKLETLFKRYFVKLEIWMNAPDSDFGGNNLGVFFRNVSGITPADLTSPKMETIEHLLGEHFNGAKVDFGDGRGQVDVEPDPNKVIIVGYNKAVSRHIFEHLSPGYKARAIHFSAGDDQAIEDFKTRDEIKILVADEMGLSEGHNLQCASRLIRTQTMWTPGSQEQTLSRCWRPDVPNKDGVFEFHRDNIFMDWIIVEPSIDVPKMARMIGKQVENAITKEISSNTQLKTVVESNADVFKEALGKRIKMNLDMIRDKKLQSRDALDPQFAAYSLYKEWERKEFADERKRLRAKVEARKGRKVKDYELAAQSMLPVESSDTAEFDPGTALQSLGYLPWVEGFTGVNLTNLSLAPLVIADPTDDEEDSEDDSEDEVNIDVSVGDPVLTEFGPGIVHRAAKVKGKRNSRMIYVRVPGFRDTPVKVFRFTTLAPTNPESREAIFLMLKSAKNGLPTIRMDDKTGVLTPQVSAIPASTVANYVSAGKTIAENKEKQAAVAPVGPKGTKGPKVAPTTRTGSQVDARAIETLFRQKLAEDPANRARWKQITQLRGMKRNAKQEALLQKLEQERIEARRKARDEVRMQGVDALQKPAPAQKTLQTPINPAGNDLEAKLAALSPQRRLALLKTLRLKAAEGELTQKEKLRRKLLIQMVQADKSGRSPSNAPGTSPSDPYTKSDKAPKVAAPISLRDTTSVDRVKKSIGTVEGSVVLFNGVYCLLVDGGTPVDNVLLKNGFDRIGESVRVRAKNPKAYRALVELLSKKFYIPPANKAALDAFADVYDTHRQNVGYLKAKETQFHIKWVRDQRVKAKQKGEIRPWPVVEDRLVYVYINVESCPAAKRIPTISMPVGVDKTVPILEPALISMVGSKSQLVRLMKVLASKNVTFSNRDDILSDLSTVN